jgi:hypothetical protein
MNNTGKAKDTPFIRPVNGTANDAWSLVPSWMANEDWYYYAPFIAEAQCVVTMLPLFMTALHWFSYDYWFGVFAVAASVASALYHAVPIDVFLLLDQLFAALLIAYTGVTYLSFDPEVLPYFVIPSIALCIDTAQRFFNWRHRVPYLHEIWHTSGGLCAHMILHHAFYGGQ